MTAAQALKAARKLFGERGAIDCNRKVTATNESRAVAFAKLMELRAARGDGPRTDEEKAAQTHCLSFKYQVGRLGPVSLPFFVIEGKGDSWEEALKDAADRKEREHQEFVRRRKELVG